MVRMVEKLPKITVVTVLYNALDEFKLTEASVLAQDYNNLEYVVVDGDSSDGSKEYCASRRELYDQFVSEPDTGIYNAMNKAVRLSSGDFVIFLNAGDEFSSPTIVSDVMEEADLNADIVYGDRYRTEINGVRTLERAGRLQDIHFSEVVYHQAVFNRRKLLADRPYDENLQLAADYKFMLETYTQGASFCYVPVAVCDFKSGGRSRSMFLRGAMEASLAAFSQLDNKEEWKNVEFLKAIVLNNAERYLVDPLARATKNTQANGDSKGVKFKGQGTDVHAERVLANILSRVSESGLVKAAFEPRVSIITVVFNDPDGLQRTINSVRALDYSNIEFIVIDGGSVEPTLEVAENNRDVIDIFISEPDEGIYDAMNKGIKIASGYYSIFMNAGDEFFDDMTLSRVFGIDFNDSYDVIYGDRLYIDSNGCETFQESKCIDEINKRMAFCHQSVFVKTSALLKFPFNLTYRSAADYDQFVRMYISGLSFYKMNATICKFYAGGTSESGLRPYLETMKIQIDQFGFEDVMNNSIYYAAFKRNTNNLLK